MPYYGPNEDSYTIFFERTFLAEIVVHGVGYGMQLILYVMCVRYLWREQRQRHARAMLLLLGYISLLFILSSLEAVIGTWTAEDTYINNRNYPGGPWTYFLLTQNLPENVAFVVVLFLSTFFSDLLVLWRCWVIWTSSASRTVASVVILLPLVMLIASLVIGSMWCLQSSMPDFSFAHKLPIRFGISYYATSFGVNIVVTSLIVLRLASLRQAILRTLPPNYAKQYLSIAAIIVESAALYSVFALAFIICYILEHPISLIVLSVSSSSQKIAGYLIILRLAQGRAWSTGTLSTNTGTTIQLST